MKKIKHIFFSILLLFSIVYVLGNDVLRDVYDLKFSIENACPSQENESRISCEPSIEEEPTIISLSNTSVSFPLNQDSLSCSDSKLPIKLFYSIWLPPDNC